MGLWRDVLQQWRVALGLLLEDPVTSRLSDWQVSAMAKLEAEFGQAKIMPFGQGRTRVCRAMKMLTAKGNLVLDCAEKWAVVAPNGTTKTEYKERVA